MIELDFDATTTDGAIEYLTYRAKQFKVFNVQLLTLNISEWGVSAIFHLNGVMYESIYILAQFRGLGLFKANNRYPIITMKECNLESYLIKHNITYKLV